MNKTGLVIIIMNLCFAVFTQKQVVDHTVYNDWKSLGSTRISNDGTFTSYEINPHQGDGYLYIVNNATGKKDSIARGKNAKFTGESNFLIFKITPGFDTPRACELKKVDKKKWPKDTLGIYFLESDSLVKIAKVNSFDVNDENDWFYYLTEPSNKKVEKKKRRWCKKKTTEVEYKSDGKELHLENRKTNDVKVIKDVNHVTFSKNGEKLAIITHRKYKTDSAWISIFNTNTNTYTEFTNSYTDIDRPAFNEQATTIAFLTSADTSKAKNYSLFLWEIENGLPAMIVDTVASFLPAGKTVSNNYTPLFTKNGELLYFGIADRQKDEPKDTLLESEKVKLDLWHYNDKRLQPQQLKEQRRDEKETNLYVYHLANHKAVQLSNDTLNVRAFKDFEGKYLLGTSNERYAHTYNWTIPYPEDHYLVSVETGEVELLFEAIEFGGNLSPAGKYYTYFDCDKMNFYALSVENKSTRCLTCKADKVYWQSDVNGMPMKAYPLGIIGWKAGEDEVWIQSEYDIWKYSFSADSIVSVTGREGELNRIKLTPEVWSRDSTYLSLENMYVYGFDEKTKGDHVYLLAEHDGHTDLRELKYADAKLTSIIKAKNSDAVIYRSQTFTEYPEVYVSNTAFDDSRKISVTNPQQANYNWGTVELIDWTSYEGIPLEGLLYKPEDFDPNKKYPLLVYYYELRSNSLHQHYIPKPTASIIFPAEYASAGYVVFIPDIKYTPGYPARAAYDCIMSGTDRVIDLLPNIDTTRMGLQGQSWGGYQTAQLITMTNRYTAAMAGAPVANMFSAYGGIRWGSGLNRQFQYERTQSRIGYTIWEKPELYFENSPLFHLPNVTTPLMIMHNDHDGAVPWYQGIELFTGLKRLGKQAWLLNYNGDDHNLMQNANRIDLSIRMRQFFDHYLQGEEAPLWLTDGIPAKVKGKELRY